MEIRDNNYYVVLAFMVTELRLKGIEKDVFAIIYGFSQNGNKFAGSLQYLMEWANASKQGVIDALKRLQDKCLIIKTETIVNNIKTIDYRVNEKMVDALLMEGVKKLDLGGSRNLTGGSKNLTANDTPNDNTISNIENIISNPTIDNINNSVERESKERKMFDEFWAIYPRKVDKQGSFKAYKNIPKLETEHPIILEAIETLKHSMQWQDKQFIPHPTTFIHQRRWENVNENESPFPKSYDEPQEHSTDEEIEKWYWDNYQEKVKVKNGRVIEWDN